MTPHDNIGFISKGSEDMANEITKNNPRFWPPHCRLRPLATKPPRISAWALCRMKKVESLTYIFVADRLTVLVYLLSNLRHESRVLYGLSMSSKLVDYGTNYQSKALIWLPVSLVINSNFGPISHRFWRTATYWL